MRAWFRTRVHKYETHILLRVRKVDEKERESSLVCEVRKIIFQKCRGEDSTSWSSRRRRRCSLLLCIRQIYSKTYLHFSVSRRVGFAQSAAASNRPQCGLVFPGKFNHVAVTECVASSSLVKYDREDSKPGNSCVSHLVIRRNSGGRRHVLPLFSFFTWNVSFYQISGASFRLFLPRSSEV